MEVTSGGRASASSGGTPVVSAAREYAERESVLCERSRQEISSSSCCELSGEPVFTESWIRLWRYLRDTSGSRNAALIMLTSTPGSEARSALARCGLVDQTREDAVGESGRKAMGPVGRNLWYAVVFGAWKEVRGLWNMVATIAVVSYAHPYDWIPAYARTGELNPSAPT